MALGKGAFCPNILLVVIFVIYFMKLLSHDMVVVLVVWRYADDGYAHFAESQFPKTRVIYLFS